MGARRKAREHALSMLYQAELADLSPEETVRVHWSREDEDDPSVREFAERLATSALERRAEIDGLIREHSHHWPLERLGAVDRNVLRLALSELLDAGQTPPAVVIDEAVELAKTYGDVESGAFVNGILEAARKRLERRDEHVPEGGATS